MPRQRALPQIRHVAMHAVEKVGERSLLAARQRLNIHAARRHAVKGRHHALPCPDTHKVPAAHFGDAERSARVRGQARRARERARQVRARELALELAVRAARMHPRLARGKLAGQAEKDAHVRARVLHERPRDARAVPAVEEHAVPHPEAVRAAEDVGDEQRARAHSCAAARVCCDILCRCCYAVSFCMVCFASL